MPEQKYSIILPVRNGGEYVKTCVQSILQQTYQHFNLIVLDNCSTDGTLEWINSLTDSRVVIHPAPSSLSIEQNWARIATVPKNEFMTCIGHDDVLLPDYLQKMETLIQQYPDASLYQTHFSFIDAGGYKIRDCLPMDARYNASAFLQHLLNMDIDVNGTGFMTRSKDYDSTGGIPAFPNLMFADFALWLNLTRLSYIAISKDNCFSYRLHQSMTATTSPERFEAAFAVFVQYLAELKKADPALQPVIHKYALNIISFYARSFSHKMLRVEKDKRSGITVASWLQKCKAYADLLVENNSFNPDALPGVSSAKVIDSNALLKKLFLLFKKIYAKPVWEK